MFNILIDRLHISTEVTYWVYWLNYELSEWENFWQYFINGLDINLQKLNYFSPWLRRGEFIICWAQSQALQKKIKRMARYLTGEQAPATRPEDLSTTPNCMRMQRKEMTPRSRPQQACSNCGSAHTIHVKITTVIIKNQNKADDLALVPC